ncbi:MAG: cupin domain-containing protein, partial [Actinomycetota bacterium]|nr:cupin domain-containing protein [Actinomycetota bacterium]
MLGARVAISVSQRGSEISLTDPFTARFDPEGGLWQVLAGGSETAGSVVFGEARLPAGAPGPHLHVHSREDEAVYVIEGQMTFSVGGRRFEAGPGTLVWLPRNVAHTFANLGRDP